MNGIGIGWGRNNREGDGTVLVAAADANQKKSQNAQQAGPTPKNHPHPSRTSHKLTIIRKRFHFNCWLEYAPAAGRHLAFGNWHLAFGRRSLALGPWQSDATSSPKGCSSGIGR